MRIKNIINRISITLLLLSNLFILGKTIASEQVPTGQLPENLEPTHKLRVITALTSTPQVGSYC